MPSSLDLNSLISPDARVPLNVSSLLHLLQNRQDEFSVRFVDVLRQMQVSLELVWRTLKSEFPEFDSIELLGPDGSALTTLGYEYLNIKSQTTSAQLTLGPQSLTIQDGTDQFDVSVGGDSVALNLVRNGNGDISIQTTPSGIVITLGAGATISINSQQVIQGRQASVSTVAGAAGAAYTATEQAMLNACAARVNDLINRLQSHGLIA